MRHREREGHGAVGAESGDGAPRRGAPWTASHQQPEGARKADPQFQREHEPADTRAAGLQPPRQNALFGATRRVALGDSSPRKLRQPLTTFRLRKFNISNYE